MTTITSFRGEYDFLSNFYPSPIRIGEQVFTCVEAAFQAQKNTSEAHRFVGLSGAEAKKLGRQVKLCSDWTTKRVAVMLWLVREKFVQNETLRHRLFSTQDAPLVEGNTWGDTYWGVCNGSGSNMLGRILMQVRSELLKKGGN